MELPAGGDSAQRAVSDVAKCCLHAYTCGFIYFGDCFCSEPLEALAILSSRSEHTTEGM